MAYIKRQFEEKDVAFFGSDSGRSQAKKVSGVVIFTTPEVRNKELEARERKYMEISTAQTKGESILSDTWVAITLLAELHGGCGYFPAHLCSRLVQSDMTLGFDVANVLDLRAMRDAGRSSRSRVAECEGCCAGYGITHMIRTV